MGTQEPLSTAEYAEARQLFDALVELPLDAREQRLHDPARSPRILEVVRRWLQADAECDASPLTGALGALREPPAAGTRFGPWRVVELIGRGGMGSVLRVERDDGTYRQQAALKLVGTRLSRQAVERFAAERQILAGLNHPNIARLIDGGADGDVPWLVMELVEGRNLLDHCAAHALGLSGRLRLFLDLCDAVAYSHRNLILHRDIKPGNVRVDHGGRLVLLDFGIAALMTASQPVRASLPEPLTPAFASPEQRRGEPVGTAADIYSLGRVLEELVAERKSDNRLLHEDLLRIIACALQPEPAARYPSVESLQADCRRALDGHVVNAGRTPARQRIAKAILRNRWQAAFALTLFLGLVGGLAGALHAALRITSERDRALVAEARAREEAATAEATTGFLIELLGSAAPSVQRGEELKVSELLDTAGERLLANEQLPDRVRGQAAHRLSLVLTELGRSDEAAVLSERALEWLGDQPSRERLEARQQWANAVLQSGQNRDLTDLHEALIAEVRQQWADDLPLLAGTLNKAAVYHMDSGNYAQAERYLGEAISLWRSLSPDYPSLATGYFNLGVIATYLNHPHAAVEHFREALRRDEAVSGALHPDVIDSLSLLSYAELNAADYPAVLATSAEVVERSSRVYPEGHWQLSRALGNRAHALQRMGRLQEALSAAALSNSGVNAIGGPPQQLFRRRLLEASILGSVARFEEARALVQRALTEVPASAAPKVRHQVMRAELLDALWGREWARLIERLPALIARLENDGESLNAAILRAELDALRCMLGEAVSPAPLPPIQERPGLLAVNRHVMLLRAQVACGVPSAQQAIADTLEAIRQAGLQEPLMVVHLAWLLSEAQGDRQAIERARRAVEQRVGAELPPDLKPYDPRLTL